MTSYTSQAKTKRAAGVIPEYRREEMHQRALRSTMSPSKRHLITDYHFYFDQVTATMHRLWMHGVPASRWMILLHTVEGMGTPAPTERGGAEYVFQTPEPRSQLVTAQAAPPATADQFMTPMSHMRRPSDGGGSVAQAPPTTSNRPRTLNEMQRQYDEMEREVFDLRLKLHHLQESYTPAGQRRTLQEEDAQQQVFQLNEELEQKERELEHARHDLAQLNKQMTEEQSQHRRDLGLAQEQTKILVIELEEATLKYQHLLAEYAKANETNAQRISELQEQLGKAQDYAKKQEDMVVTCGQQIGAYMQKCKDLEAVLDNKDKDIEKQRERTRYLEIALKDLERKYAEAMEETKTKEELRAQLSAAQAAKAAAEAERDRLRTENVALEHKAQEAEDKLHQRERQAEEVAYVEAMAIADLQGQLQSVRDELRSTQDAFLDHDHQLKAAMTEQQRLRDDLKRAADTRATMQNQHALEMHGKNNKVRQKEVEAEKLHDSIHEYERRYRALEQAHNLMQDSFSQLQGQLAAERALTSTLRATIENIGMSPPPPPSTHTTTHPPAPPLTHTASRASYATGGGASYADASTGPPRRQPMQQQQHAPQHTAPPPPPSTASVKPRLDASLSLNTSALSERRTGQSTSPTNLNRPPFKAGSILDLPGRKSTGLENTKRSKGEPQRRDHSARRRSQAPGAASSEMVNCHGGESTRSAAHDQHHHDYGDRNGHHHRHGASHHDRGHADSRSHNHSRQQQQQQQQQHRNSDSIAHDCHEAHTDHSPSPSSSSEPSSHEGSSVAATLDGGREGREEATKRRGEDGRARHRHHRHTHPQPQNTGDESDRHTYAGMSRSESMAARIGQSSPAEGRRSHRKSSEERMVQTTASTSPEDLLEALRSLRAATESSAPGAHAAGADFLDQCFRLLSASNNPERATHTAIGGHSTSIPASVSRDAMGRSESVNNFDAKNVEACLGPFVEKLAGMDLTVTVDDLMRQVEGSPADPRLSSHGVQHVESKMAPPSPKSAIDAADTIADEVLARAYTQWREAHPEVLRGAGVRP